MAAYLKLVTKQKGVCFYTSYMLYGQAYLIILSIVVICYLHMSFQHVDLFSLSTWFIRRVIKRSFSSLRLDPNRCIKFNCGFQLSIISIQHHTFTFVPPNKAFIVRDAAGWAYCISISGSKVIFDRHSKEQSGKLSGLVLIEGVINKFKYVK